MKYSINIECKDLFDNKIKKEIYNLENMYLKKNLSESGGKVAFYYENAVTGDIISYNPEICFYAASSIKILVCVMILEQAANKKIDLNEEILVTMSDLKHDTGIIKYQKKDTKYTIKKLLELTITESDNTAYIKLVNYVGKDNLIKYGKSLGATHTLEGKDLFGIINCSDMIIYWQKVYNFINNNEYGGIFKKWLLNPSFSIITNNSINNKPFVKKYGSWDIAYHEAGYIEDKEDFYLIILTQLNKKKNKKAFVNNTANKILNIHNLLKEFK